jgi:hypothetical protein
MSRRCTRAWAVESGTIQIHDRQNREMDGSDSLEAEPWEAGYPYNLNIVV